MVRGMAGRCPVCGLPTDAPICPRCATILLRDRAICPTCGKMFPGRIAVCDACGRGLDGDLDESEERSVRSFALVPGMDEPTARRLHARGFRDFADVIKLGLPESAVRKGLHHTISRKILLGSVVPEAEVAFIEKRLAGVQGSLAPLADDPDFRSMPDTVRQEILREISTMLVSPSLPSDTEFRAQIEAWRRKGFDVDPI